MTARLFALRAHINAGPGAVGLARICRSRADKLARHQDRMLLKRLPSTYTVGSITAAADSVKAREPHDRVGPQTTTTVRLDDVRKMQDGCGRHVEVIKFEKFAGASY
jgi:hypothetical protein